MIFTLPISVSTTAPFVTMFLLTKWVLAEFSSTVRISTFLLELSLGSITLILFATVALVLVPFPLATISFLTSSPILVSAGVLPNSKLLLFLFPSYTFQDHLKIVLGCDRTDTTNSILQNS